jgi:hypothetical protein
MIEAPGYERLITHVFRDHDQYLDSDVVFGVRSSLVADWVEGPDGVYSAELRLCAEPGGTMIYTFTLIDKPEMAALRQRVRPEHKAYIANVADRIAFAGPLTHDDGVAMICTTNC